MTPTDHTCRGVCAPLLDVLLNRLARDGRLVTLPPPDGRTEEVLAPGDPQLDWPFWRDSGGNRWTAYTDGVADDHADLEEDLDAVRRDALARLAAVHRVEAWAREVGS